MNSYNAFNTGVIFENKKSRRNKSSLIKFELLYVLFAYLGNRFNSAFFLISIGVAIFTIISSEKENVFYFSLFIIPSIRMFDSIGVSFVVNLLLVFIIVIFLLKVREISKFVWFVDILIIYEVFHLFCYSDYLSMVENIVSLFGIIFGFVVCSNKSVKISKDETAKNLMLGVILSSICYLLLNGNFLINWYNNLGSEIWRFSSFSGDPNALALYSLLAISLFISSESLSGKYIPILALSLIVIMTFSKMGIILLLFNIIVMFWSHKNESKQILLVVFLPVILIGIALFFSDFFINLYGGFLERFFREDSAASLNTLTSGRFGIDVLHFEYILESPLYLLFGEGMDYAVYSGINHVAHNTYLDVLFSWGIVGVVLIFVLMYYWTKYCISNQSKRPKKYYLPVITLMGAFMSLSFFSASMLWFIVAACFVPLRSNEVLSDGEI